MYTIISTDIASTFWFQRIYRERIITGPALEEDCSNECLNVDRGTCELFVFNSEDNTCYLGTVSVSGNTGSVTSVPVDSSIIYTVTGKDQRINLTDISHAGGYCLNIL
jgi:hypothetical protein